MTLLPVRSGSGLPLQRRGELHYQIVDLYHPLNSLCSAFTYPYPPPRHCDPPVEDVTRSPLCRPIPQRPEAEAPFSTAQFFASRRAAPPASASSSSEDLLAASMSSDGVSDFLIARDRFIPAIHGSDIPKASVVVIRPTTGPPAPLPTADTSASDDDDEAEKGLCSAHGVLCVSGICMECAARKREAKLAERALERGGGRGRGWGQMSEREPRKEHAGMRRGDRQPQDRAAALPRHLKAAGAGGKQDDGPRSRVRDDIRIEMANRAHTGTQGAKSVASSGTRALPPHLGKVSSDTRKTVKPRTPAFAASTSDTSSAPMSTSAPSDDGLSESSHTSELSSFEPSSEDANPMPFRPTAVFSAPPIHPPGLRIPDADRGAGRPWGPRAAIPEEDTKSVAEETHVALENAWKQVRATRPAPLKQADKAKAVPSVAPAAVRDSWDDDSSEDEDSEPF